MRRIDSSSAEPSAGGVAPAAMPVLPPCGTSGTRCSAASRTIVGDFLGRGRGEHRRRRRRARGPRQSLTHGSISPGSVITRLGTELLPGLGDQLRLRVSWRHSALGTAARPRQSGGMDRPPITLIVARAQNGVIGRDGTLPWHLPADLKRFKALTMGSVMVMGRKTFESLPGVLPGRRHVVMTRDRDGSADGAEIAHGVDEALRIAGASRCR